MQVCFGVGVEELEGEWMGSDGVGDGKGRRGGHTMTISMGWPDHFTFALCCVLTVDYTMSSLQDS